MFNFLHAVITNTPMGRVYATTAKSYYVAGELVQGNIICEAKVRRLTAGGEDTSRRPQSICAAAIF
jgi:hypothetical protein